MTTLADRLIIAIPSMGRAGRVTSLEALGGALRDVAVLYVPERERAAYAATYDGVEVVGVDDQIRGITRTRNVMIEDGISRGKRWMIQMDDDGDGWLVFEGGPKRISGKSRVHVLAEDRRAAFVAGMFEMAEDMGTNLWGMSVSYDPRFYREYSPFSLTSVVVGNFMGIVLDDQRFDERLALKEDYDFSLESLRRHRRVLRTNKYAWKVEHHTTEGGCRSYRTMKAELEAVETLRRKWGRAIVGAHHKKPYEVRVKVPIPGI
jgi:hypothetical protein